MAQAKSIAPASPMRGLPFSRSDRSAVGRPVLRAQARARAPTAVTLQPERSSDSSADMGERPLRASASRGNVELLPASDRLRSGAEATWPVPACSQRLSPARDAAIAIAPSSPMRGQWLKSSTRSRDAPGAVHRARTAAPAASRRKLLLSCREAREDKPIAMASVAAPSDVAPVSVSERRESDTDAAPDNRSARAPTSISPTSGDPLTPRDSNVREEWAPSNACVRRSRSPPCREQPFKNS